MTNVNDMAEKITLDFLAMHYLFITQVRKAAIAIDHSAESAMNAEWAVLVTDFKGCGTKFVLKHLLQEGSQYCKLFEKFRNLLAHKLYSNQGNIWLRDANNLVDNLIKTMHVTPEDYKNYDCCRNIRDMAREFERVIGKKLDEAVMFFLHRN